MDAAALFIFVGRFLVTSIHENLFLIYYFRPDLLFAVPNESLFTVTIGGDSSELFGFLI